jgi:hypothetical protein
MSKTITAVRRGVALLLFPVLLLQACSAATGAGSFPLEKQLDRGVVDETIELKVDAGTAEHLVDAEEASRLRDAGVIPLAWSFGILALGRSSLKAQEWP